MMARGTARQARIGRSCGVSDRFGTAAIKAPTWVQGRITEPVCVNHNPCSRPVQRRWFEQRD